MIRNSHAACAHAATKVGRAQCRKARAAAIQAGLNADLAVIDNAQAVRAADDARIQAELADIDARFAKLTANQIAQAEAVTRRFIDLDSISFADMRRYAVLLADAARAKKTTVAKLSRATISEIFPYA
ncbi:hypothetical protein SEA_HEXBUG_39 [Gordonia phage Hexbug]|nr:hypothetical protein SEA_HEXBUG_39 [Gordonia phage Hexbug]